LKLAQRLFIGAHRALYRASGGRIGAKLGSLDHLLLTTTGRRSGLPRQHPLACFRDGDAWIVVASKGGADEHPAWYRNLQTQPEVEIQHGTRRERRRARTADAAERARLWPDLVRFNPAFASYAQRTAREIPVVILEPIAGERSLRTPPAD
jgi:deazaflavin-dependent oxidoreductase (nitroreductase family)